MSDDLVFLLILLAIAGAFIYAVRRGGPVPRGSRDAMLLGAAGDSSMPFDAGHHGGGPCDAGGHSGGGDAGSCDGGGGGHG